MNFFVDGSTYEIKSTKRILNNLVQTNSANSETWIDGPYLKGQVVVNVGIEYYTKTDDNGYIDESG